MLVLTRKLQQSIRIGDDITITILRVKGNSVRVGIDAPRDVRVVRGELPEFEEVAHAAHAVADVEPSFAEEVEEGEEMPTDGIPADWIVSAMAS